MPPLVAAGKNLKLPSPRSSPAMMFAALATPGRKGMPAATAASPRLSVRPGETMNSAPASSASSSIFALSTVPAPTTAPATDFIALIATGPAGGRRVGSEERRGGQEGGGTG